MSQPDPPVSPQPSPHYPTQPTGVAPSGAGPDAVARLAARVRTLTLVALLSLLVSVASLVVAGVALSRPVVNLAGQAPAGAPASTTATTPAKPTRSDAGEAGPGTIVVGAVGKNQPVLDIYEDFQCPACAQVEKYFGSEVDAMVAANTVEVRYHMMSFLDQMLKNDSSVRAAAGGFCAADQGKFLAWHDTLFANHPAKEGDGWTDAQLAGFATKAGLDVAAWQACVASGKHVEEVKQANDRALQSGVNSTPTYLLNGSILNLQSVANSGGLKVVVDSVR